MSINIYFDGDKNNIKYIIDDLDYNETSYDKCDFVISCKFTWGIKNFNFIQENINFYNNYSRYFNEHQEGLLEDIPDGSIKRSMNDKGVDYSGRAFSYDNQFKSGEIIADVMSLDLPKVTESGKKLEKLVIIFLISDTCDKFTIPHNVFLFRTSLYKSQISNNEYLLPYVWEKIDKSFILLKKTENPVIGFCGNVDQYRKNIIEKLKITKNITNNFIIRDRFWGGKPHDPMIIQDFVNNILSSHFTICNRGNGNFSMRFYQVLSAGRIPVLVNTDMIFPFENEIMWNEIVIIGKNEEDVISKIFQWWNEKDIENIQIQCKMIYDTYFDKKNFFNKIFNNIKNINNKDIVSSNTYLISKMLKQYDSFDMNIYKKYNDLSNFKEQDLLNHYFTYGVKENRIAVLPDNFNINIYKKYEDLKNMSKNELIIHYINYGQKEDRKIN